jgi:hypothetical protein
MQIVSGAKTDDIAFVFGHAINPTARGSIEWTFIAVTQKKILTKILAQLFKKITQMANHRIVAQNRMAFLRDVPQVKKHDRQRQCQRKQHANAHRKDAGHHQSP